MKKKATFPSTKGILCLLVLFTILTVTGYAQNVGIDNTNPQQPLDVTGNVKFSGAFMPGGDPGTPGQVPKSTGPGTAPVWSSLGQRAVTVYGTATVTISSSTIWMLIPGLTTSITIPTTSCIVILSTSGGIIGQGTPSAIDISFFDGINKIGSMCSGVSPSDSKLGLIYAGSWSTTQAFSLTSGVHTISVQAKTDFANSSVSAATGNPLEGVLTVMILEL